MPTSLSGNEINQTSGNTTRASSASGHDRTNRIAHNNTAFKIFIFKLSSPPNRTRSAWVKLQNYSPGQFMEADELSANDWLTCASQREGCPYPRAPGRFAQGETHPKFA